MVFLKYCKGIKWYIPLRPNRNNAGVLRLHSIWGLRPYKCPKIVKMGIKRGLKHEITFFCENMVSLKPLTALNGIIT